MQYSELKLCEVLQNNEFHFHEDTFTVTHM